MGGQSCLVLLYSQTPFVLGFFIIRGLLISSLEEDMKKSQTTSTRTQKNQNGNNLYTRTKLNRDKQAHIHQLNRVERTPLP